MRKRLVSAALAAAMALSMTACTSNPAEKETEAAAPADTEAAEEGEEKEAAADGDLITVGMHRLVLSLTGEQPTPNLSNLHLLRKMVTN